MAESPSFRDARFQGEDFRGATFRDCNLERVKVVDAWLGDVNLSGMVRNLRVNDVDVTAFVESELDRRQPERVQLRAMNAAADVTAMWATLTRRWGEAIERAGVLAEPERQTRVDDEWSFVETLRHLVFVVDAWAARTILDDPQPYHPWGYPHSSTPPADSAAVGIDLAAQPEFDDAVAVWRGRAATVDGIVAGLTDRDAARVCRLAPAPWYPPHPHTVRQCLGVVLEEHLDHLRYAERDLAVLEASG